MFHLPINSYTGIMMCLYYPYKLILTDRLTDRLTILSVI